MTARHRERERLMEAVVSADRERAPDGRILPPAAFWDLSPEDREAAYGSRSWRETSRRPGIPRD